MVERLHCQLKTALSMRLEQERWVQHLSAVLLGLRSFVKADLECTTTELVYGAPLRLPGDFFTTIYHGTPLQPQDYLRELRHLFHTLQPTPPHQHVDKNICVGADFAVRTCVFLRRDLVKSPLTSLT